MKKMIKLSLVAAVAVAGFTTTASAKALTEAIQDVDVSGLVRYRIGNKTTDQDELRTEHVKIVLGLKAKVNDSVTASVKAVSASTEDNDAMGGNTATINVAKFTYTTGATNATVGLQELATPWTDAADGARANGALVTTKAGSVTLAAAYFRDSKMGSDSHADLDANALTAIAAIGSLGDISYQAWYLNMAEADANEAIAEASSSSLASEGGDALALLVNGTFGPVAVNASYAYLDPDVAAVKKQSLTKVMATVDAGVATIIAGIADGGKDGNLVTFDSDAAVGFQSWNIRAGQGNQADLGAYTIAAVIPAGDVSVKFQYTKCDYDSTVAAVAAVAEEAAVPGNAGTAAVTAVDAYATSTEVNEKLIQVSYAMSKNFNTYIRYADVDQEVTRTSTGIVTTTDIKRTRIELAYKF